MRSLSCVVLSFFFLFKQKTAYEMRISDWSSDVCSSDLSARVAAHLRQAIAGHGGWLPFDQWMAQALYAPGLGYYAAGNIKMASSGATSAQGLPIAPRSEERREGKECVRQVISRWPQYQSKQNNDKHIHNTKKKNT